MRSVTLVAFWFVVLYVVTMGIGGEQTITVYRDSCLTGGT